MTGIAQTEQRVDARFFDTPTLVAATGGLLAVSGWQVAAGFSNTVPQIGSAEGSFFSQAMYDSAQHLGPSLVVGFAIGSVAEQCYRHSIEPGFDPPEARATLVFGGVSVLGALAANVANETVEIVTGHDVLFREVKPSPSDTDISLGAITVAATLVLAAGVSWMRQRLRS